MKKKIRERKSGILLHPVSLPGKHGIGDLGQESYNFVNLLEHLEQSLWQILPLNPVSDNGCPYSSSSAFAGNPLLINIDKLKDYGYHPEGFDLNFSNNNPYQINYPNVINFKYSIFNEIFNRYKSSIKNSNEFQNFCYINSFWINDFALFCSLKQHFNYQPWWEWPEDIKTRKTTVLKKYAKNLAESILKHKFLQWLFFKQWFELKKYANEKTISIIGDIPIFVSYDSADVWANQKLFLLKKGKPIYLSGVPPDYFSETGQLWGNPLYNWKNIEKNNFDWWKQRFKTVLKTCDIVRVDHFRGFESCWAIPVGETTAINGSWIKSPGYKFFNALRKELGELNIIAEDLGEITEEVYELRDHFEFPCMKILQFAFSGDPKNSFLPHNFETTNTVAYTGTHDNNTTKGWFKELPEQEKKYVSEYFPTSNENNINWILIKEVLFSVAKYAIIPLQDILNIDSVGRFNFPGKTEDNWQWRFTWNQLNKTLENKFKNLTILSNRSNIGKNGQGNL